MGVLRSGSKAFEALDESSEIERLIAKGDRLGIVPKEEFKNIQWIPILNYISNILFASFCFVSILSLAIGGCMIFPLGASLLFGSLMMSLASLVVKLGSKAEERKLEFLKANDLEKKYTYRS
jgi:hypothetical protein